jgi:hypothetical protein
MRDRVITTGIAIMTIAVTLLVATLAMQVR